MLFYILEAVLLVFVAWFAWRFMGDEVRVGLGLAFLVLLWLLCVLFWAAVISVFR